MNLFLPLFLSLSTISAPRDPLSLLSTASPLGIAVFSLHFHLLLSPLVNAGTLPLTSPFSHHSILVSFVVNGVDFAFSWTLEFSICNRIWILRLLKFLASLFAVCFFRWILLSFCVVISSLSSRVQTSSCSCSSTVNSFFRFQAMCVLFSNAILLHWCFIYVPMNYADTHAEILVYPLFVFGMLKPLQLWFSSLCTFFVMNKTSLSFRKGCWNFQSCW